MATVTMTKATVGLNLLRDALSSQNSATSKITYFAVGTGTTAPSAGDAKLVAEVYRSVFQSAAGGSTGVEDLFGFIDLAFANGVTLTEAGIFGGATATSTANSGILIARGLFNPTIVKNNGITVQIDFSCIFS